jgi:hypothetical protein
MPMASTASTAACTTTAIKLNELVADGYMSVETRAHCQCVYGEAEPCPRANEVVAFYHYFRASFDFPARPFLRGVLFHYRICLHHLAPNAITVLAVFAAFCEAWLGIWPDLNILTRYFRGNASGGAYPWGSGSFFLTLRVCVWGEGSPLHSYPAHLLELGVEEVVVLRRHHQSSLDAGVLLRGRGGLRSIRVGPRDRVAVEVPAHGVSHHLPSHCQFVRHPRGSRVHQPSRHAARRAVPWHVEIRRG